MAPLSDPASANCWVTQNRRPATAEDQDKRWKQKIVTKHSWLISMFNFLQRLAVRTGRSSFSPLCLFSFPQLFIFRMKNMPARTSQANQSKARGVEGGGQDTTLLAGNTGAGLQPAAGSPSPSQRHVLWREPGRGSAWLPWLRDRPRRAGPRGRHLTAGGGAAAAGPRPPSPGPGAASEGLG